MSVQQIVFIFGCLFSSLAFGWGALGHRIIAENAANIVQPSVLAQCHLVAADLVAHVNDPDTIWRAQRIKHPHEAQAHFFHVDRQPSDWRSRPNAKDRDQGFLVYRIWDWINDSKKLKREKKWEDLNEHLYGIAHYLGDLTQPMHLYHDYDGREAGLPDIHAQFETKLLNRFEDEVRTKVKTQLNLEKIPPYWSTLNLRAIIFDTAQQSFGKVARLYSLARPALQVPHSRRKRTNPVEPRFTKPILWKQTGTIAVEQLALASRLLAFTLNQICSEGFIK